MVLLVSGLICAAVAAGSSSSAIIGGCLVGVGVGAAIGNAVNRNSSETEAYARAEKQVRMAKIKSEEKIAMDKNQKENEIKKEAYAFLNKIADSMSFEEKEKIRNKINGKGGMEND